jgi:hypothetical protein
VWAVRRAKNRAVQREGDRAGRVAATDVVVEGVGIEGRDDHAVPTVPGAQRVLTARGRLQHVQQGRGLVASPLREGDRHADAGPVERTVVVTRQAPLDRDPIDRPVAESGRCCPRRTRPSCLPS